MKSKPRKVYERVYIHAAKTRTIKDGWVSVIHAMDAFSEYAFNPVINETPEITIDVLNQLFDSILKDYNPLSHPKQIVFVTNLPEKYEQLIKQTKAAHHRFVFNKQATNNAMKELFRLMQYEMVEL